MNASRRAIGLWLVGFLGVVMPMDAQARSIEVTAARVRMGDLLRDVPEPWASLDMGAAPEPMQEARYTKDDIEARAYKARLPLPQDIEVPRVLRVVRTGQVVTEPHLANLVRQNLIAALPPGTRIRSLRLNGGVVLPQGPVYIRPELPEVLEHGEQLLRIGVGVRSDAQGSHTVVEACVDMQLHSRRKGVPVLGRGSEVTVQIVTKGVLVQASGLAQEPGSIGDYIKVLPIQGNRMLQARIIDARTVEVRL